MLLSLPIAINCTSKLEYCCRNFLFDKSLTLKGFVMIPHGFILLPCGFILILMVLFWQVKNDELHLTLVRGHVDGSEIIDGFTASTAMTAASSVSNGPVPFCK